MSRAYQTQIRTMQHFQPVRWTRLSLDRPSRSSKITAARICMALCVHLRGRAEHFRPHKETIMKRLAVVAVAVLALAACKAKENAAPAADSTATAAPAMAPAPAAADTGMKHDSTMMKSDTGAKPQ